VPAAYTYTAVCTSASHETSSPVSATFAVEEPEPEALATIDDEIAALMAALPPPGCPDVRVNLRGGVVEILRPVTFEARRAEFKREGDSEVILNQVGMTLVIIKQVCSNHGLPHAKFEVQGHTNARPETRASPKQMQLSEQRAAAVIEYITKEANEDIMRADAADLTAKGYGGVERKFEEPDDVSLNQRVEFVLLNVDELILDDPLQPASKAQAARLVASIDGSARAEEQDLAAEFEDLAGILADHDTNP